jgi:hypothetical protein
VHHDGHVICNMKCICNVKCMQYLISNDLPSWMSQSQCNVDVIFHMKCSGFTIKDQPAHVVDANALCTPRKLDFKCHPVSGLVLSDASSSDIPYHYCAQQACHTDSLHIHNGVAFNPGFVSVGWSLVRLCLSCGYMS